ncbi:MULTISPECIES: hypothetical protein [Metallibacterium]|jgi:DNA-directed RNA polymerase subunit RPC12/RpoP|uniref:hypothetical protein n=1 Tax=Metallibacterium TaxID=1218803 RepID=UPI0026354A1C|nr:MULTISPECIES: hypothetical protein [Metallibacterium]MBW8075271.1 hypothetical protein [Metallibacterium scheffleri]
MSAPVGYQLDLFVPAGARTYLATLVLDSGAHCRECGSREIYVQRQPYQAKGKSCAHVGAYCAGCGRWIRWINAAERARALAQDKNSN